MCAFSRPDGRFRGVLACYALAFVSSAAVMTLELVAARLVAQHLGVSLYTWTAVIAVVLGGISLGNYAGGKLADLYPARGLLAALFLLSSVTSVLVLFLVDWMGTWARPEWLPWPFWILRNVAIIFLPPATMLGTISPVVARAALLGRARVGATVGALYAAGAVGSIFGTLLTGYLLIDRLGSRSVVLLVAAVLALLGLLAGLGLRRRPTPFFGVWLGVLLLVAALAIGPWPTAVAWGRFLGLRYDEDNLHYRDESNYFTIEVYDAEGLANTRVLALDHLVHSYVAMDDPTRLEYAYETVYAALLARLASTAAPPRVLFLGGGGYTFPRYVEQIFPDAEIDVVEIDPAVKRAAQRALGLPPDGHTRIRTHAMDARNFVADALAAGASGHYDFVFGDAFNDLSVPFHLTTDEFNRQVARLLRPGGAYAVNVVDVYRPGYGRFLGAFVATMRRSFANVYVWSGEPDGVTDERDTFVVLGCDRRVDVADLGVRPGEPAPQGTLFAWAEGKLLGGDMATLLERGRGVVLTDDHAPVDNLLAPVFALQEP